MKKLIVVATLLLCTACVVKLTCRFGEDHESGRANPRSCHWKSVLKGMEGVEEVDKNRLPQNP